MNNRNILLTILFFVILNLYLSLSAEDNNEALKRKRFEEVKKSTTEADPVKFYGKVVDQYAKPVGDATINLTVDSFKEITFLRITPESSTYTVQTDEKGDFSFGIESKVKGYSLNIKGITKQGYVWSYASELSPRSFDYRTFRKHFIPDPANPVIFHMRKRGENPTYLMTNRDFDFDLSFGEEVVRSFIDLKYDWEEKARKAREEDGDYVKDFLSKHYDVKVSAVFDKEKSDWTVTFTAAGENCGFILDDKFLSEAPESGYNKEFKIVQHVATEKEKEEYENSEEDGNWDKFQKLTEFKFKGKYLYVKSRDPAIYTRMELSESYAELEDIRINANTATNPYGERNLEFNDELPLNLSDRLYGSVVDAFLADKLPEKPDINKMFEEFKKTHKQVKHETEDRLIWIEK